MRPYYTKFLPKRQFFEQTQQNYFTFFFAAWYDEIYDKTDIYDEAHPVACRGDASCSGV